MIAIVAIIIGILAFVIGTTLRKAGKKQESTILSLGGVVAIIFALAQFFTVIPAGTVGVIDIFGTVSDNTLKPGINFVNPLARIVKYSFKTQEFKETMKVPSKEGLIVQLEISLQYRLDPQTANNIYKTVEAGDYLNVLLIPQFRSVVRSVTANYEAKAVYTSAREQLATDMVVELQRLVGPRGIKIEAAPLRQITLPARLTQSIEEKLQAEQESQRMAFILKKEEQEAERKRIEAKGISDFQAIVSEGINNQLLRWKGIEATEKLASSPNSKVVVIGSGKDGLPLILGGSN